MASESAELPVTPEVTTSPPVVEKRRCSIGKAGSGKSNEKIVPRYLRASTGSCHDICKYGGNHSFDPKERRSIPNRATRKQLYQTRGESIGGMIAKSKLSVDSKLTKMSADVLEESADSKPTKMSMVVLKEAVYSKARTSDALDAKNRKKTSSVEVKPSLVSKSHTSPSTSQEISSSTDKEMQSQSKSASRKVETPSKSTSKTVKTPSKSTSKVDRISKRISEFKVPSKSTVVPVEAVPKSILKKVENPSNSTSKVKTSSKSTSKTEGTSSHLPSSNGKLLAKPSTSLSSIRSIRVARNNVSSSTKSLEGFGDKGSNEIKTEKKVASFKASPRKLIVPIKALSSPRASKKHQNLKIVSPLKNQKAVKKVELEEHNNLRNQKTLKKVELEENKIHEAKEKTLYVIEMETENKTLQSNQKVISYDDESYLPQLLTPESSSTSVTQSLSEENHEESEYTTSEYEVDTLSGNSEIESIVNNETLMAEKIGKQRKVKEEEDKDCEMTKLKFRRGKMVDDQSERNTPRKLKFRRAKTLVEKANVKEKVVLRHQSFEDKKDAQGLFNNVIEETASKLVEARKSKVKALVGAFETVISLQEK